MSLIEDAKKAAARQAVDDYVLRDGMRIGIGSGSTIVYAVERLAELVQEKQYKDIQCVPTSFQSRNLIIENSLQLCDLNVCPSLDLTIDGADEIDANLNLIKGGGAAHLQEKCVAYNSKIFVVVADYRKQCQVLGTSWLKGIPIEVLPFAYQSVMNALEGMKGNTCLRLAKCKAGPVVTDNGNFIVDVTFDDISERDLNELNDSLLRVPGVVETGLFAGDKVTRAYIGLEDGTTTFIQHQ